MRTYRRALVRWYLGTDNCYGEQNMQNAPKDVRDIRIAERNSTNNHHEMRIHDVGRASARHDELERDFDAGIRVNGVPTALTHRADYTDRATIACSLLDEAKAAATHPGMDRAVGLLATIVAKDARSGDAFFSFRDRLDAAWQRYEATRSAMLAALTAWEAGTSDPKEAGRLFSAKISSEAAWRAADLEVAALCDPPALPVASMPVDSWGDARSRSEELARLYGEFGAQFDSKAKRPQVDVIAVARSQARSTVDESVTSLWPIAEVRCITSAPSGHREDLLRVFAEREHVRFERANYGEFAR